MLDTTTPQLTLWSATDGADQWTLRESRRARRLSVRVFRSGRIEIVVPPRTSQYRISKFLAEHRAWIERKRAQARCSVAAAEPFPPLAIALAACGESWRIHLAGGGGPARISTLAPGLLGLYGNTGDSLQNLHAVRRWLKQRAHDFLAPLLAEIARARGFTYSRVSIRRQRTRWGSCSTRGTICLNVALLFQNPAVVRYLLIHELAHTRHMNHSRRFWQCVAGHCADYRRLDRELSDGWRHVPAWLLDSH